jgi:hypothetical protein
MISAFKALRKFTVSETNWKLHINEFIKLIHPDRFNGAPDFITQANNSALRDFNTYMRCIDTNQPSPKVVLQFYTKAKDYNANILQLEAIEPNSSITDIGNHINKSCFR